MREENDWKPCYICNTIERSCSRDAVVAVMLRELPYDEQHDGVNFILPLISEPAVIRRFIRVYGCVCVCVCVCVCACVRACACGRACA
jgi:hypothetical protein